MKSKILTLVVGLFLTSTMAFAQAPQTADASKGIATFAATSHDFGKINEADGNASYTFEFTNTGKAPLILTNVAASCGCTTPSWTKDPILPGKKGSVTATYAAPGRPGIFVKSLTVSCNGEPTTIVLEIKGEVIPKPVEAAK